MGSTVSILEYFGKIFEACQSNLGGLEDVDPNSAIYPNSPVVPADPLPNTICFSCQLLRVLVQHCQQSVSQSHYHLNTLDVRHKVFLKNTKQSLLVLCVAMLEEGEESEGSQRE
jgi:hypothetical protein